MAMVYIGVGSNLGDRLALLRKAVGRLGEAITITRISPLYETEPVDNPDQPRFLNAVVAGETDLEPQALLAVLQAIEADLGRTRPFHAAPRTIDLDLLFYDDCMMEQVELTLPHPRLHERFFVLVPLADMAPELMHPRLERSIRELLEQLGDGREKIHFVSSELE